MIFKKNKFIFVLMLKTLNLISCKRIYIYRAKSSTLLTSHANNSRLSACVHHGQMATTTLISYQVLTSYKSDDVSARSKHKLAELESNYL